MAGIAPASSKKNLRASTGLGSFKDSSWLKNCQKNQLEGVFYKTFQEKTPNS